MRTIVVSFVTDERNHHPVGNHKPVPLKVWHQLELALGKPPKLHKGARVKIDRPLPDPGPHSSRTWLR